MTKYSVERIKTPYRGNWSLGWKVIRVRGLERATVSLWPGHGLAKPSNDTNWHTEATC